VTPSCVVCAASEIRIQSPGQGRGQGHGQGDLEGHVQGQGVSVSGATGVSGKSCDVTSSKSNAIPSVTMATLRPTPVSATTYDDISLINVFSSVV